MRGILPGLLQAFLTLKKGLKEGRDALSFVWEEVILAAAAANTAAANTLRLTTAGGA